MKKVKTTHGTYRFVKEALKLLEKRVYGKTTNNYRKMHGKPMHRKGD